jgi:acyl-CoA reductase-like NAD-dependent aldehyde dehydrogenase
VALSYARRHRPSRRHDDQRDLRVPFGGMKHSGLGREGGDHSIDFYTEQKTICIAL